MSWAKMRIIDFILYRNLREGQHLWNYSRIHPFIFELIVDLFRRDEKRQKREWEALGYNKEKYYPLEHFPFDK